MRGVMASKNKCAEIMGWLSRQYRIDFTDPDILDDWERAFDRCTDEQMDAGRNGIEENYNDTTYRPTTAIFLKHAQSLKTISPGRTYNPSKFWKDDKGRDVADLTMLMEDSFQVSDPAKAIIARENFFNVHRGFVGEVSTPLYRINKMRESQGRPPFKSQQAWDAYAKAEKGKINA